MCFAEIDKNPPIRRNTQKQHLQNSDQNLTKHPRKGLFLKILPNNCLKTRLLDETPCTVTPSIADRSEGLLFFMFFIFSFFSFFHFFIFLFTFFIFLFFIFHIFSFFHSLSFSIFSIFSFFFHFFFHFSLPGPF